MLDAEYDAVRRETRSVRISLRVIEKNAEQPPTYYAGANEKRDLSCT